MLRFQCDSCGKLKGSNDEWILGLAAESIGLTSARREISIVESWERGRAVDPLAVHFCSDQCRTEYVEALFAGNQRTLDGEPAVPRRRLKRLIPGAVVDTMVAEKRKPVTARRKTTG